MLNKISTIMPRLDTTSINEWVYNILCFLIINGEFSPGTNISLRGIAKPLNVSPTPVREAIRRLISEGALETSTSNRIMLSKINKSKFDELLQIRLALEPELAASAIKNIDKKTLKTLITIDEKLDYAISIGNVRDYIKYNYEFHFGIYNRSSSSVILPIVKSTWLQFSPSYRVVAGRVGTNILEDFHKFAISAIKNNNENGLHKAIYNDIQGGMELLNQTISKKI